MNPQYSENSILDKVMQASDESELASFNPVEIVGILFRELPDREQDILRRRFGLHGNDSETLEQIGKTYNVTRERVRQIENSAIKHIKGLPHFTDTLKQLDHVVYTVLERHGGIMAEDHLLEYVLQPVSDVSTHGNHLLFVLHKLSNAQIVRETNGEYHPVWRIEVTPWDKAEATINEMVRIMEAHGQPITQEELLEKFKQSEVYATHKAHFDFDEAEMHPIRAHVRVAKQFKTNPFGEWGLAHWNTVTPKRMGDKIYLVMKKHGKPLHFRDIADHINNAKFDRKRAYPPTVHNELILDKRYVLVGRGIYALTEWGFAPGVVSDVIEQVLKDTSNPMSRDEIVEAVLNQRLVKKGTVYLALSNNKKFEKNNEGKYYLVTV